MGFRIPAVAVSPYARRRRGRRDARVRHAQLGFESILQASSPTASGSGPSPTRDKYATNIGETFDWAQPALRAARPARPEHVASRPCALGGGDVLTQESAAAHVSDLAALEDLADRFGVPAGDGKVSDLFTKPDAIRRAAKRGTLDDALEQAAAVVPGLP